MRVVAYLRERIARGDWIEGEKIPSENQLAESLGVSRASIRTALQYLTGLGVLKSHQGRGTILMDADVENWGEAAGRITAEDCRDIYRVLEFRQMLEPEVCRAAAKHVTPEAIAELERRLDEMRQCHFQGDSANFVRADLAFHEALCRCSGNPLAIKSLRAVFSKNRHNHEQMNALFGYESGIRCHTALLDAFRVGDSEAICAIMRRHIQEALDRIEDML